MYKNGSHVEHDCEVEDMLTWIADSKNVSLALTDVTEGHCFSWSKESFLKGVEDIVTIFQYNCTIFLEYSRLKFGIGRYSESTCHLASVYRIIR